MFGKEFRKKTENFCLFIKTFVLISRSPSMFVCVTVSVFDSEKIGLDPMKFGWKIGSMMHQVLYSCTKQLYN